MSSDALTALWSVDRHPAQSHVIATGGADGCVTLFDIRKECAPVTRLQIHDDDGEYDLYERANTAKMHRLVV